MSEWSIPKVDVSAPRRGPGVQTPFSFRAQAVSLTWTWGSQPDSGKLTFVSNGAYPSVTVGAFLALRLFGKTFWGVCQNGPSLNADGSAIAMARSSHGHSIILNFLDTRVYLRHDIIFGVFNREVVRTENGVRVRYYKHLLPAIYRLYQWKYTARPLSAAVILDLIFNAPSVGTSWVRSYHVDQFLYPVYEVDCENGRRMDEVLQEISEKQGLTFTVQGDAFRLVWARKGDGFLPTYTGRADDIQLSRQLSGNSTRVFVVGDRNLYLVMNLPLHPDWNRNYEEFLSQTEFVEDIFNRGRIPGTDTPFNAVPGDSAETGYSIGRMLAQARALEITVGEYAALNTDKDFSDSRRYGGRSRMQMPVALYLTELMFRAFRPPSTLSINGVTARTEFMEITDTLPARLDHDPVTGIITASLSEVVDGNGYAIAQGYKVGNDLFRQVNPDRFDVEQWTSSQDLWSQVPFQIDQSGEDGRFIIFDAPVIRSPDLIQTKNGWAFTNAAAAVDIPQVRAALAFLWDRYFLTYPQNLNNPSRDEQVNVNGLHGEYIVDLTKNTSVEVPYADGMLADAKAVNIALPLLRRQEIYEQGSFRVKLKTDDVIPDLVGLTNRISLECSADGHVLIVELTSERPDKVQTRPTELDRIARQSSLLPGQAELRTEAKRLRVDASGLRQQSKWNKILADAWTHRLGSGEPLVKTRVL